MNHANMLKVQIEVVYYSGVRLCCRFKARHEVGGGRANIKFAFNNQALILPRFAADR